MDRSLIEQKLARRPHSPLFARLADAYLAEGRTAEARELLVSGLEKYPAYPAARLVLARCHAAERSFDAAIAELRRAAASIPDATHLAALEADWSAASEPTPEPAETLAVEAVAVELPPSEPTPAAPAEESVIEATVEEVAVEEVTLAPDPVVQPPEPPRPEPVQPARRARTERRIEDTRIVSKTLAEIYAMQGEYGEAIITYTMLKQHRPEAAAECDLRISELEQALQAKLNQQKNALTK